jgi:hypothetical protein
MAISALRNTHAAVALTSQLKQTSWPILPLVAIHGAAIGIMALTESTPVSMLFFLLTWGLLNCFWLALARRPLLAGFISLALIAGLVALSAFKHAVMWMTIDFLDVMLIDFGTVTYLLTIYPALRPIGVALIVVAIIAAALLWRYDSSRVSRRAAVLGCVACLGGLIALAFVAPGNWWEVFSKKSFVSKFSRSGVAQVSELMTHGYMEADATVADTLPQPVDCVPPATRAHIVLIHDESGFDIRAAPGIKVPAGYGSHFLSFDGKARRFLVESYGGASWYAEFNVLAGLSARSFGRFAYFLPRVAAGRVHRGLPLALRRCGYRTFSFYPADAEFMSAKAFHASTGLDHFFDYRDMGTKHVEPDSFYYDFAATKLRHEHGAGPMFAYVYHAANHAPYNRAWRPNLLPGWHDPGNTPEVDEYLRRQTRGAQDYRAFVERLRRDFPDEPFLLVRYGDHQPTFSTFIMDPDLDEASIALRMRNYDRRYLSTYYVIDTINYQPVDMAAALETLDGAYLPLVIQRIIGLPLDPSFVEQQKVFERCGGIFYGCASGAEARRFNRMLLDAGFLKRL